MRNLKRALSLALSTVMLFGMMVVGTGASYKDVTSKHNQEAIDVMKAVGVMIGDDKGNFNPDQKVTRNEMAVIMANMLDLKVNDFSAASTKFTDVPAWAAKYVAACKADGIIAGYSETKFGGSDTVTAAQAALMMLKALGYFQYQSDFGADWQLATVKQASKIDLFDGVDVSAGTPLTRNEVAQLALNALEATMVETDGNGGTTIKGDGFEITTGSAKYVEVEKKDYKYDNIKNDDLVQLGEKLFDGKLVKGNANDETGRPGTKWTYDGDKIGVYGNEADYVVVLEKQYKSGDDAEKILRDLTDNDDLAFADELDVYVNGAKQTGSVAQYATYGTVVELYCDDDVIETVVALDYTLAKIQDVSTKLTKAQKEDGATAKIKIDGKYYLDIDIADYDEDTYVEDAYILYVADEDAKDNVILASELAETVEGKVTNKKGSDVKIDGEWYGVAGVEVKVGDEGTFYLNKAGQIELADTESAKSDNYAYIYNIKLLDGETNDDGFNEKDGKKVYVVLADGTKASYVVEEKSLEKVEKGIVVAYSITSDDEFKVETAKDTIADEAVVESVDKGDAAIGKLNTNSSTKFIFVNVDGSKVKVSTNTGYKNVNIDEKAIWTVADDKTVLYAFVMAKDEGVTTDAELAVVLDDEAVVSENEDGDEEYTYTVAIDGEETELTFEKEQEFVMGAVISYTMDGDYAVVEEVLEVATVEAANDDYIRIGDKQYNLGDETVYTITMEYEDEADKTVDTVTVNEGGKIEDGSKIYYTLDDGDLDVVFVIEEIR